MLNKKTFYSKSILYFDKNIKSIEARKMSLFLNYFFDSVYETDSLKDAEQKINSTILVTELSTDGIKLIDYAKSINKPIIVIVYAEKPTVELLIHIVEKGITKFITHPFDAIKFGQILEKIYTEFFTLDNLKISPLYYINAKEKTLYFSHTQINQNLNLKCNFLKFS